MKQGTTELLRGTLDLLILAVVSPEEVHGWGVMNRLVDLTEGDLNFKQGSIYPALQRLTRRGWLRSEWRSSENNRRARYYGLTAVGRRQLVIEMERWERIKSGVQEVLAYASP